VNFKYKQNIFLSCLIATIFAMSLLATTIFHSSVVMAEKPSNQPTTPTEWTKVEEALGKKGTLQSGDVFKVGFPRHDLKVTARGVQIKPTLALGSWVAFKKMNDRAMVMGDLVLTNDEITPVMTKLQENGIEQTALHNHIPDPTPTILYMHIQGQGDSVKLAQGIHEALSLTKTPLTTPTPSGNAELEIDTAQIDRILTAQGKVNGGVYQFSIPRPEKILENGMEVPPAMGTATVINFQPTGDGKAAIALRILVRTVL
jgi:hypothetical protein